MKYRFETQKKTHPIRDTAVSVVCFLAILFIFQKGTVLVAGHVSDQEAVILERAISRGIVHCYAAEGAYPEDLQYLKDNYGLTYDEDRFFVDYQVLGSNLVPDITIIDRRNRQ